MKRNHSLLEYSWNNDTQVSELGPYGPSYKESQKNKYKYLVIFLKT